MVGAGVDYRGKRFVTHTTLHHRNSAVYTLTGWQFVFMISVIGLVLAGLLLNAHLVLSIIVAVLSVVYFADAVFSFFVIVKSLHFPVEMEFSDGEFQELNSKTLPLYTILCPLYREAKILLQFVKAMDSLNWPTNRLEVLLLLEQNDEETIDAVKKMNLPAHFKILIVPHSLPKTKPKACNYGLAHARGSLIVIYDAEDKPEPDQLKKAYLGFAKSDHRVACLQAKLNYYNPHHNFLTMLFTAEYSLWFDVILPGFQSINTAIPLGGTSNHFRTDVLRKLEGWDPFNVTEDADLGIRLFKSGYKTAIIDSVTYEEANSNIRNWIRQRSRWIKGYFQTYLVHTRSPLNFVKKHGFHTLFFHLVMGARMSSPPFFGQWFVNGLLVKSHPKFLWRHL